MDNLLDAFSGASITSTLNSVSREHPRLAQYKVKESKVSQAERRKKFLEAQRAKRFDYVNHARQLATNEPIADQDLDLAEGYVDSNDDDMECEFRPTKSKRLYQDQLMMSEWMVEVPEDLNLNWILAFCPIGKRSLVVSSRGYTKAYSRNGYMLNSFPSSLPDGNKRQKTGMSATGYTILDCIYNEMEKTYYVLDMMCWNGHPLYDSEADFRFYWVGTKFIEECPDAMTHSPHNPFKFVPLPHHDLKNQPLKEILWDIKPFEVEMDGLLFFHKKSHYLPKQTPLVVWLKPFMVPEILQIPIPDSMSATRPSTYTTMQAHLPKAFEQNEKRKAKEEQVMQCEEA